MKTLFSLLLSFLICSTALLTAGKEPVSIEIELPDQRTFTGVPVSFKNKILTIRIEIDRGEIDRGFPIGDISEIRFSDRERVAAARKQLKEDSKENIITILEKIWLPRAPFLQILDEKTIELLIELPAAHLNSGDLYRAVGLAQRLLPHAKNAKQKDRIDELILVGHLRLELWPEAENLAREWIDNQPRFPSSALGWRVLAELALEENRFSDLVWIALQPIAIGDLEPIDHLADCYALAIHGFHELEENERAAELFHEMKQLDLAWPKNEKLAETFSEYSQPADESDFEEELAPETDLDLRPPEKDLTLPIEQVRKTVQPP